MNELRAEGAPRAAAGGDAAVATHNVVASEPVRVRVNGRLRQLLGRTTLATLLHEIGVDANRGIAVAVNERVVPGAAFEAQELRDGDTVEIIRAVAGG